MFLLLSTGLLLLILILLSIKDITQGILPDFYLIVLALLGLMQFTTSHVWSAFILGGLGYTLYKLYPCLKGKQGLGFGDVKMMAVGGLWLAPSQIPLFLILSGLGGVLTALLWKYLKKGPRFPLGPALAFALGICIVGNHGFSKVGVGTMITHCPLHGSGLALLTHPALASGDDAHAT